MINQTQVATLLDAASDAVLRESAVGALTSSAKDAPVRLPAAPSAYWSSAESRTFVVVVEVVTTGNTGNTVEIYGGSPSDVNATTLLTTVPAGATGEHIRSVTVPATCDRLAVRGVVISGNLNYGARLLQHSAR